MDQSEKVITSGRRSGKEPFAADCHQTCLAIRVTIPSDVQVADTGFSAVIPFGLASLGTRHPNAEAIHHVTHMTSIIAVFRT
jgi:hypothetical protein